MAPTTKVSLHKSIPSCIALAITLLACGRSTATLAPTVSEDRVPTTATEPAQSPPSSPTNPVPLGSQITLEDVTLSVTEVVLPADESVQQGSSLNPTPIAATHYLFVRVAQVCEARSGLTCPLGPLRLVDSAGEVHFPHIDLIGVPCELHVGEFASGDSRDQCLIFLAPAGDQGILLRYESFFGQEAYFALQ